jgi:hypothetical protein
MTETLLMLPIRQKIATELFSLMANRNRFTRSCEATDMPSEEQTYRQGIDQRFDRFDTDVRQSLSRIELAQRDLDKNQKFTNGKVRKIIVALVLVFGILIGQNFGSARDVISLIVSGLHP